MDLEFSLKVANIHVTLSAIYQIHSLLASYAIPYLIAYSFFWGHPIYENEVKASVDQSCPTRGRYDRELTLI
jgi:hypothetical protein